MKVVVTGGAGYIGSHTARELRRQGHSVALFDNLSTGHAFLARGFDLTVGDLRDDAKLTATLDGADAVIHFAALACVADSVRNPRPYFDNNVRAGLNLLDACVDCGVKYVVFSSTSAIYGVPKSVPITEDMPSSPVNPYGTSKLLVENALKAYDEAYGLRYVALRYFNAAGADPGGEVGELHDPETHLVPLALRAADCGEALEIYGADYPTPDGTCVRDYVHVTDLARAHALALDYLAGGGRSDVLNLGTGVGYSVKQIVDAVARVTGRPVPQRVGSRRPGDPPILVASAERARTTLGWQHQYALDDMIATAWRWMKTHAAVAGAGR
ncbi:MAG: UDP-glucose 4-epimerase GalE [Terriglobales bacterium]